MRENPPEDLVELFAEFAEAAGVRVNPGGDLVADDAIEQLELGRFHEWLLSERIAPSIYDEERWDDLLDELGVDDGDRQAAILEGVANYQV